MGGAGWNMGGAGRNTLNAIEKVKSKEQNDKNSKTERGFRVRNEKLEKEIFNKSKRQNHLHNGVCKPVL